MKNLIIYQYSLCIFFWAITSHCFSQIELKWYQGIPEGNITSMNKEERVTTDAGREALTKVSYPSVFYVKPNSSNTTNTAVIICPGGGYHRLSIYDGGFDVANEMAAAGIHVFILKYRTFIDSSYINYEKLPLQDLSAAYQVIVKNSNIWNIDTAKIGIMGFSAGGHLAAMASTPHLRLKLAFQILIYPVISFNDSLVSSRLQARKMLIGKQFSEDKKNLFSPELWVTSENPPTYLIHASDDTQSLVGNSLVYYKALFEKNVPVQMLIYQKGGHGFALHNKELNEFWMPSALNWLRYNKML